jgi:adenosylhomocysteine nucleosidase
MVPGERALRAVRTVLVVAAERRELRGILRKCRSVRSLGWPLQFARSGELNGQRLLMVAHGPGGLAAKAVEEALARENVNAVVSTGFCGGLDPDLGIGEVIVALRVTGGGKSYGTAQPAAGRKFRTGEVASTACVAGTVAEKQRLRACGASAVEMEAAAVAGRAQESGLPFYCVRAVMDPAREGFLLDFNRLRDRDGRFSRFRILRAALARPWASLPELIRLERQGRIAARALGDFIADCRF